MLKTSKNILGKLLLGSLMALSLIAATSCNATPDKRLTPDDILMNAFDYAGSTNVLGGSSGLYYYVDTTLNQAVVAQGEFNGTTVTIPSSYQADASASVYPIVGIKESGFANDSTLRYVTFDVSDNFTMIGSQAFMNSGLRSITVPAKVASLSPSTFALCRSLTAVNFASGSLCTAIGDHCFSGDVYLKTCPPPVGLLSVGDSAFENCIAFLQMIFPVGFTTLGESAFDSCLNLGLVYFPASTTTLGAMAFKNCPKARAYFASTSLPGTYTDQGDWNYVLSTYPTATSANPMPDATSVTYVPVTVNTSNIGYGGSDTDGYYTYVRDSSDTRTGDDYDIVIIIYNGLGEGVDPSTLVIPNVINDGANDHRVVGIDTLAFGNHTELTSVTFQSNLRFINSQGFFGCYNLGTINFQGATSLQTIGDDAFRATSSDPKNFKDTYFSGLTELYFPHSVTSIGAYAFSGIKKLEKITFQQDSEGDTTTVGSDLVIGAEAFEYDGSSAFTKAGTHPTLSVGALTLPARTSSIGDYAFGYCDFVTKLTFASAGTLAIGANAFYQEHFLSELTFPSGTNSRVSIGSAAFALSSFSADTLGWNCYMLHYVFLSKNVITFVDNQPFNCRIYLTFVTDYPSNPGKTGAQASDFPDSVWAQKWNATWSNLSVPNFGDGASLGYGTINYVSSEDVVYHYVPAGGTRTLFTFCPTTNAAGNTSAVLIRYHWDGTATETAYLTPTIPASYVLNGTTYNVEQIGQMAFAWCTSNDVNNWADCAGALTRVTLPSTNLKSIIRYAFAGNRNLSEVDTGGTFGDFPTTLTSIADHAFAYTALTSVNLPSGLATLADAKPPFLGCFKLTSLKVNGDSTANGQTFYSLNNVIYKSGGNTAHYKTAYAIADGASFSDDGTSGCLKISSGTTVLGTSCLMGQRKITSLKLPYSITSIPSNVIYPTTAVAPDGYPGSSSLQSVTFYPQTTGASYALTTINSSAFETCLNLTTFEWPSTITTIGSKAFNNDAKLKSFPTSTNPNPADGVLDLSGTSLSSVGTYAFASCAALTSVSFPSTTTAIPQACFQNDTTLASFTFGNQTTSIGPYAFASTKLTSVTIPDTVTSIGSQAYLSVSTLTSVHLPAALTLIDSSAFSSDSNLASVSWASSVTSGTVEFKGGAFYGCSSLTSFLIPKCGKMPTTSSGSVFLGCTGLNGSGGVGTTTGLFLDMKETYYLSVKNTNFANGWNYYQNGLGLPYGCYAESAADIDTTASHITTMKYWHYVNGVPTFWTPA